MKKRIIICCTLALAALYSCKNDSANKTVENKAVAVKSTATVKTEIDMLRDSVEARWNEMILSDDEKIADIKRLLQEISYTPRYDVKQYTLLLAANEQLSSRRYDRQSMADSDRIDAYDMAQDSVIKPLFALTLSTPSIENYPLAEKLLNEIQALDNDVVIYRSRYDQMAKEYNAYLQAYRQQLQQLGKPYDTLQPLPLFEISN